MPEIKVLDEHTIDKIAAGEVVERPSSIVKELVENAVDAGASAVTIEIKDGGISFIRITDNGQGIPKAQVPAAFLRHATSKLTSIEDLLTISSLGFRGEALSSIAAVSQVELITKTASELTGTKYIIEGSREKSMEDIGAPEGTTFLVRNLFFNTPARQKFLKSAQTEASYISTLAERLALSHPDISFQFIANGQPKLRTNGNGNVRDIIYHIFGRDIAAGVMPIQEEQQLFSINGFIGKPFISRGNRNYEIYFINGRYIKSNLIAKCMEDAYKPYLMKHQYPFAVLQITMDSTLMDVNVHPAKMEVRFRQGEDIYKGLTNAIRSALEHKDIIPQVPPKEEKKKPEKKQNQPRRPEPFEKKRLEAIAATVQKDSPYERKYEQAQSYIGNKNREAVQGESIQEETTQGKTAREEITQAETVQEETAQGKTVQGKFLQEELAQRKLLQKEAAQGEAVQEITVQREILQKEAAQGKAEQEITAQRDILQKTAAQGETEQETTVQREILQKAAAQGEAEQEITVQRELLPKAAAAREAVQAGAVREDTLSYLDMHLNRKQPQPEIQPSAYEQLTIAESSSYHADFIQEAKRRNYTIIGQLFDTYWLVQVEDELFIIDQHAAHEKVLYEKMMQQLSAQEFSAQQVSPPVIVTMTMQEQELFHKYEDQFLRIGFEVNSFGGREYAVCAVPANLYGLNQKELFMEMLDSLSQDTGRNTPDMILEKIASMSCKAAVKGSQHLSHAEARQLLADLLELENPYNCPHGRPTIISMSRTEIEKKFKRIV